MPLLTGRPRGPAFYENYAAKPIAFAGPNCYFCLGQSFIIKGKVNPDVKAPAKAYRYFNKGYVDSTTAKNGRFTFKGHVVAPGKAFVLLSCHGSTHDMNGLDLLQADLRSGFYLESGTTTLLVPIH